MKRFRNPPTPHCHQQSLDSAAKPEEFVKRELELDTGSITVTDHGSLSAVRHVYELGKKNGLTPILGCEFYLRDDDCPIILGAGHQKDEDGTLAEYFKYAHLTAHFTTFESYQVAMRRLSDADKRAERHGSERKPLFSWEDLEELGASGATFCSSCLIGAVCRHLLSQNRPDLAEAYYVKLRSLVKPGHFFAEVFPHDCSTKWDTAVYITYVNGESERFAPWKSVRLEGEPKNSKVKDLAKKYGGKDLTKTPVVLVGVVENRKLVERAPLGVLKIEYTEGELKNECMPWALDGDYQKGCNEFVLRLAEKYGDPVICSTDAHYAYPESKIIQDIRLASMGDWKFTGQYHLMDADEMFGFFKHKLNVDEKTFEKWVDNAYMFRDLFKNFKYEDKLSLPTKFYPTETKDVTLSHLFQLINKHGRMDWTNAAMVERLKVEIDLFHSNGTIDLIPYFFLAEDACSFYASQKRLNGPGRGSAAAVLVNYLLGITHVQPLEAELPLERFLTLDRIKTGKLPDVDLDFSDRDVLVDSETGYLKGRFGDHAVPLGTETKLKLRSAVKDVVRVRIGFVPPEVENLTKAFENAPQGIEDIDHVMGYESPDGWVQGSIERDGALQEFVRKYPIDWENVQKLSGLIRNRSRHACSWVIANQPIKTFIPTTSVSGIEVTQYSPSWVEKVGGLKMDFLGVSTLLDIEKAIKLVQKRVLGKEIEEDMGINGLKVPSFRLVPTKNGQMCDIWDLPEETEVFKEVAEGRTETVFQFSTSSAVGWLPYFNRLKADKSGKLINSVMDMAVFTALDRPGPLDAYFTTDTGNQHNALVEYTRRAAGEVPYDSMALLNEVVPETQGLLVFQEGLSKFYRYLTDCTGPEAEEFRGWVGKKQKDKINKAYPNFMEKATTKLGSETEAKRAWDMIQVWGNYGFCKAHAYSYGVTAYACAWLKYHYPLEWWTAVLGNGSKDEINETFWNFCGHLIDLPDISLSGEQFEIVNERIRAPINLLLGVGEAAHRQICLLRPYRDIVDFVEKHEKFKLDGAVPVLDKEGNTVLVLDKKTKLLKPKMKKARSAVTRGVAYKLIIAGVFDSLFPKTLSFTIGETTTERAITTEEKLQMYEAALAAAQGKKSSKSIDAKFMKLTGITKFQYTKAILPAYTEKLLPLVAATNTTIIKQKGGAYYRVGKNTELPILNASGIDYINGLEIFPTTEAKCAVIGYVIADRRFRYGENKSKEASELTLDLEGKRYAWVKWPDRDGKLPVEMGKDLTGSVVVAKLLKNNEKKPFVVTKVDVIAKSLDEQEEESAEESE